MAVRRKGTSRGRKGTSRGRKGTSRGRKGTSNTAVTISLAQKQIGIKGSVTLNALGGGSNDSYIWSVPTYPSGSACPVSLEQSGSSCKVTGECFGTVTVKVTVKVTGTTIEKTAAEDISVGSVVIAGPDGNYYHCFPSGATVAITAETAKTQGTENELKALGSCVFGDATDDAAITYVSELGLKANSKSTSNTAGTTAVTCFLLNLTSFTPPPKG